MQRPGQVQVIGVDHWNGSAAQLQNFKNVTGATYPLLLNGTLAAGGNIQTLYGTYDNYLVIDKAGVVRYHAALNYAQGARYQLNEIRAAVDAAVVVDAGGVAPPPAIALAASPNPVREVGRVTFTLPAPQARVRLSVHDVSGRELATLWDGPAGLGASSAAWDLADARGRRVPPGVYLVRGSFGDRVVTRRWVVGQ